MSSLFGLAEQFLSSGAGGGGSSDEPEQPARRTGEQEYNTPHHRQQPQGSYDTQEVLSHANDVDEDSRGYVENAIQHVHSNPHQHNEEVDAGAMAQYGPMIMSALSSVGSQKGMDISSLVSGGLGSGGGNQLMGLVMSQVSKSVTGGGEQKQSMMNGAAMTLTKLVAQKQLSSFIGGSNSGGLGMLGSVGGSFLKSQFK